MFGLEGGVQHLSILKEILKYLHLNFLPAAMFFTIIANVCEQ